jgi:hypothetical protein
MTDDTVISYQAAAPGTPVLSSTGTQIGTLEHVLEVPELDVFDGIVIPQAIGVGRRGHRRSRPRETARQFTRCG